MREGTRLVTAAELEKLRHDDSRYELVGGQLVRMSPVGFEHGRIVVRLVTLLDAHVRARRLGVIVTEVGFRLASGPDTVRAPDVAFVRQDRVASGRLRGFWHGAPDLAVEVLSPEERRDDLREKVEDYVRCGTPVVVVVDPDARTVAVHRQRLPPVVLGGDGAVLDLDDVLPGFRCTVGDLLPAERQA